MAFCYSTINELRQLSLHKTAWNMPVQRLQVAEHLHRHWQKTLPFLDPRDHTGVFTRVSDLLLPKQTNSYSS